MDYDHRRGAGAYLFDHRAGTCRLFLPGIFEKPDAGPGSDRLLEPAHAGAFHRPVFTAVLFTAGPQNKDATLPASADQPEKTGQFLPGLLDPEFS